MEFGYWEENFTQWPLFVENGITNNGEADVFFNFDRIAGAGGSIWLHPAVRARDGRGDRDDKQIIMNGDGLLAEVPKDGHEHHPALHRSPPS